MEIEFLGATGEVTGSRYLIHAAGHRVLLECGQIQGSHADQARNVEPLPLPVDQIDAVVISHAHIDHSGRLPLLVRHGYSGPIYMQHASRALCEIMLRDSGYLHEKDAQWENKKRERKGLEPVTPLFTRDDAEQTMGLIKSVGYDTAKEILPGLSICFRDAGHILGSAIVEIQTQNDGATQKLVFSGDLGQAESPLMEGPAKIREADLVVMESTYGNRLHRPFEATLAELAEIFSAANASGGNILIPAFAVGRTQDLLYLMAKHFDDWGLGGWKIFLDSPMAIQATDVYYRYRNLYEAKLFRDGSARPDLRNLEMSRTSEDSIAINTLKSGAIIIAGSGMCTGGRIKHHLKNNIWRKACHIIFVGFQARGTLGRKIVDGAERIRLWGETINVGATVHTVGGLSAHADQQGLLDWYAGFKGKPPVYLVHGEPKNQAVLAARLREAGGHDVHIAKYRQRVRVG
ncbi:MAG: MBL fold metallo-hydrolase [Gammaproteobacteria bacterium]|nr:MBL fold metallo-hydrolase [Gammaproteobacteria bacterium]